MESVFYPETTHAFRSDKKSLSTLVRASQEGRNSAANISKSATPPSASTATVTWRSAASSIPTINTTCVPR